MFYAIDDNIDFSMFVNSYNIIPIYWDEFGRETFCLFYNIRDRQIKCFTEPVEFRKTYKPLEWYLKNSKIISSLNDLEVISKHTQSHFIKQIIHVICNEFNQCKNLKKRLFILSCIFAEMVDAIQNDKSLIGRDQKSIANIAYYTRCDYTTFIKFRIPIEKKYAEKSYRGIEPRLSQITFKGKMLNYAYIGLINGLPSIDNINVFVTMNHLYKRLGIYKKLKLNMQYYIALRKKTI